MSITAVVVLFAVVWFMVLFIVLPLRLTTQGDAGSVVEGTPQGAPLNEIVGKKARLTTFWAIIVWTVLAAIITSGAISVRDFDWMERMPPVSTE